jgi:hypothetical protein
MQTVDLKQMQQYHGIRVTLKEAMHRRNRAREGNQKLEFG